MATVYKQMFPSSISKSQFEHLPGIVPNQGTDTTLRKILPIIDLTGNTQTHEQFHQNLSSRLGMQKGYIHGHCDKRSFLYII